MKFFLSLVASVGFFGGLWIISGGFSDRDRYQIAAGVIILLLAWAFVAFAGLGTGGDTGLCGSGAAAFDC